MLKGFCSYTISDNEDLPSRPLRTPAFFENTQCVSCRHRVAYLPDLQLVGSLDPDGTDRWRSPLAQAAESGYRLCHNDKIEGICNWALPADDDNPLCVSCRITRVIPNLADPAHRSAWYRLEVVVSPRGRQATSALQAHRARSDDAKRDRRSGAGVDVRLSCGCRSGRDPSAGAR